MVLLLNLTLKPSLRVLVPRTRLTTRSAANPGT
jgi:hypothetical protein